MGVEETWKDEISKLKKDIKTIRENEILHIDQRLSRLENEITSSIKRALPFIACLFVATLLGLFAIFYGFTNNIWSAIWGGFGTIIIILASIVVASRR